MPAPAPRPAPEASLAPSVSRGSIVGVPDIEEAVAGKLVRRGPGLWSQSGHANGYASRKRQSVKSYGLVRVSRDAGGRVDHWLLTDANEAGGGPVEILDQQYHSGD
jgi:hypothetical protein